MSGAIQKAREAAEELRYTAAAFIEIREDAHKALLDADITHERAFEIAVTLRALDAVQNKLIGIVENAEYEEKANQLSTQQGEQG